MKGVFITGTDTGVGKTLVATALIRQLQSTGQNVAGYKPVSAGCERVNGQFQNDDAQALLKVSPSVPNYEQINPIALEPAIAPHIAASEAGLTINLPSLVSGYGNLAAEHDCVVVEGAGGWRVPLNDHEGMDDLAVALDLPVLLVVGLRLGCINHSLLTVESIRARGLNLLGWVANHLSDSIPRSQENIDSLIARIDAPLLAELPYGDPPDIAEMALRFQLHRVL